MIQSKRLATRSFSVSSTFHIKWLTLATNLAMNTQATNFYREFFSDLSIDRSEAGELTAFLNKLQPPPGKLIWLRSQAFRVGNEFLTNEKEKNKSLLRAINYIVHAIETTCMQ
jgi:hypothetical protein